MTAFEPPSSFSSWVLICFINVDLPVPRVPCSHNRAEPGSSLHSQYCGSQSIHFPVFPAPDPMRSILSFATPSRKRFTQSGFHRVRARARGNQKCIGLRHRALTLLFFLVVQIGQTIKYLSCLWIITACNQDFEATYLCLPAALPQLTDVS